MGCLQQLTLTSGCLSLWNRIVLPKCSGEASGPDSAELFTHYIAMRSIYFFDGTLRRSSSKKLNTKDNLLGDESPVSIGVFNTAIRLPSGWRS